MEDWSTEKHMSIHKSLVLIAKARHVGFEYRKNICQHIKVCYLSHRQDEKFGTYRIGKVSKGAKISNRYKQVPHLTQDTNGKVTNSQLDTTNESQEVSPFPAGDHKAHINRRTQRHSKHKTEQKHKRSTKEVRLGTVSKLFYWRA